MLRWLLPACLLLVVAAPAAAQPYGGAPLDPLRPRTDLTVDFAAARMRSAAGEGLAFTAGFGLAHCFRVFCGAIQLPTRAVRPEATGVIGGGLGDLGLEAGLLLSHAEGEHSLRLGVAAALPIGASGVGLGSGHLELEAFFAAATAWGPFAFHLRLSDLLSIPDLAHPERTFVTPHHGHELRYEGGVQLRLAGSFYLDASMGGATALTPADLGRTVLHVRPGLGFAVDPQLWVGLSAWLPIGSARRFDGAGGATVHLLL